jgi:predicted butyrate kinase (DUF1464 family)
VILLELGGAFTAAIAVQAGRIVDGAGGSSGPLGVRSAGALDGEAAFLAGQVSKDMLFSGGAAAVAGTPNAPAEILAFADTPRGRLAVDAFVESAVKAVAALAVSAPRASDVVLSGRVAFVPAIRDQLSARLSSALPGLSIHSLAGFASTAKHASQGAALVADGLSGGASAPLVQALGIRDARGTVLDHLYVISPADARRRLGIV